MPLQSVKLALILLGCEKPVESRERKDVEKIQATGKKRPGHKTGGRPSSPDKGDLGVHEREHDKSESSVPGQIYQLFLSVHGEDSYPTKASCGQFPGIRPLLLTAAHALCECCACCELASDMENVMSGGSAACVKFQSWGKFLAFNRR